MYFPYVFGRQSELLAIRSSSNKYLSSGRVIPIVEPVVTKPNAVVKCLEMLDKDGYQAVLITNPYRGEFDGAPDAAWKKAINDALVAYPNILPALQCRAGMSMATIQAFTKKYADRDIALLYFNSGLLDADMKALVSLPNVRYHICLQGKMTAAHMALLPKAKTIYVTDNFNKQNRNADYAGPEPFTDVHKHYLKTSAGFGDYTIIGSEIQLGGGPPGAVAVHASYKDAATGDIWVHHFVSDETDVKVGTAGGKYLEAVAKLAKVGPPRKPEFGTNDALDAYFADHAASHFPGLGKNKERQIHHHIAVMHDVLIGKI